ncbi:hypothetical protein EV360DRAFT_74797 [Lentinula raphanica]|nr:hypothetical protein EV360DRAFT_74797 [Lentinula raphanica]
MLTPGLEFLLPRRPSIPHQIWRTIYEDNCFTKKRLSQSYIRPSRLYIYTFKSRPPQFNHRRMEYIYSNAVLLLRAASRMTPYLMQQNLEKVVDIAWQAVRFDESWMFDGLDAICPLWGKVQTAGLATAMKILYEFDDIVFKFSESIQAATQSMSLAQPVRASIAERIDIKNVRGGGLGADSLETRTRAPYIFVLQRQSVLMRRRRYSSVGYYGCEITRVSHSVAVTDFRGRDAYDENRILRRT